VAALYDDFDPSRAPEAPQGPTSLHERPRLDNAYVAPGEGLERQLAATWQRFLGLEKVGIHDNFFELGGTSLIGVQMVAEIGRTLGREVPTVSLFEAPTIAALARYLAPKEDAEPAFAQTRSRIHKKKSALAHRRRRRRRRGPAKVRAAIEEPTPG
jgi:acyl carrier protein